MNHLPRMTAVRALLLAGASYRLSPCYWPGFARRDSAWLGLGHAPDRACVQKTWRWLVFGL